MTPDWTDLLSDPKMRPVWIIALVTALFIVIVARFGPKPKGSPEQVRELVRQVTGITPIQPKAAARNWALWIGSILCFCSGMLLQTISITNRHGQSILGWLLIAIFLLSGILFKNMRIRGPFAIVDRLRRADYDGALAKADALLRWFPQKFLFYDLRGSVLRYAGRLTEAEQACRKGIGLALATPGAIVVLENLGDLLVRQQRYREAMAVFEAAAKIHPRSYNATGGMAEVLLRQDREPERALRLLDQALEMQQSNARTRNLDRHNVGNMQADRALALAMLGRMDEAAQAAVLAGDSGDPGFIPGLAGTAWRCGLALVRMQRPETAADQFRRASELDPAGLYGKLAAKELHAGVALIE
jgi:tetratricopeptide (TPR) repeat protein